MTIEEKAKAYDEAIKRAKEVIRKMNMYDGTCIKEDIEDIFPQLAENEDERIRKWIVEELEITRDAMSGKNDYSDDPDIIARLKRLDEALFWLEKQKEQNEDVSLQPIIYTEQGEVLAEQKPNPTEDMPYVADEHFFEREPADSFKYRLAEYMTKNCKKGEGPYGYSYNISSESILQMAKEELIKRGELKEQKPAEWSEEDETHLGWIIECFDSWKYQVPEFADQYQSAIAWLKSLRPQPKEEWTDEDQKALKVVTNIFMEHGVKMVNYPGFVHWLKNLPKRFTLSSPASWKPTEEQMEAFRIYLYNPQYIDNSEDIKIKLVESLYNDLKKLM